MSKKNSLQSLGDVYGSMLDRVVVTESKPGEIGAAPLEKAGGPANADGFVEPELDVTKLKDSEENAYNIRGLSYGAGNSPGNVNGPLPTGDTRAYIGAVGSEEDEEDEDGTDEEEDDMDHENLEEDEETVQIDEKSVRKSLNSFMANKSVFDRLYSKVVNENFGESDDLGTEELDALGLDDAEPGSEEVGEEVTITLNREHAQTLCDLITAALGSDEADDFEDGDEFEASEEFPEEDEEGHPTPLNTSYDDGKENKVGSLKPGGAASAKGTTAKVDPGSSHTGKYDDGKNNVVGSLKTNQGAFE